VILAPVLVAAAFTLSQVDVSHRAGAQDEPTIAASPTDPSVLIAATNDAGWGTAVFTSTDGGTTWTASNPLAGPIATDCAEGDPGAAIADDGRELVSYLAFPCASSTPGDASSSVYVSTRPGATGLWKPVLVIGAGGANDDKPAVTWDDGASSPHHGRAYLVWDRYTATEDRLVISHSDDGGQTWSGPRPVRGTSSTSGTVSVDGLAVGPRGTVYLTWEDENNAVWVSRATDGGQAFRAPVRIAATRFPFSPSCEENPESGGVAAIPAQARRCVDVNVSVAVRRGGVVVVYTARRRVGAQLGIYARRFDPALRWRSAPVRIRPSVGRVRSDQFMPVAAADRNSGLIWACWYDTSGDATRRSAVFTCSASRDGRRWAAALPVASARSDESGPPAGDLQFGDY
jgi:hypothetical protein